LIALVLLPFWYNSPLGRHFCSASCIHFESPDVSAGAHPVHLSGIILLLHNLRTKGSMGTNRYTNLVINELSHLLNCFGVACGDWVRCCVFPCLLRLPPPTPYACSRNMIHKRTHIFIEYIRNACINLCETRASPRAKQSWASNGWCR
jgi:hypothetical protein